MSTARSPFGRCLCRLPITCATIHFCSQSRSRSVRFLYKDLEGALPPARSLQSRTRAIRSLDLQEHFQLNKLTVLQSRTRAIRSLDKRYQVLIQFLYLLQSRTRAIRSLDDFNESIMLQITFVAIPHSGNSV